MLRHAFDIAYDIRPPVASDVQSKNEFSAVTVGIDNLDPEIIRLRWHCIRSPVVFRRGLRYLKYPATHSWENRAQRDAGRQRTLPSKSNYAFCSLRNNLLL